MNLESWIKQEPTNGNVEVGGGGRNTFVDFMNSLREKMIEKGFKEIVLPPAVDKGDVILARGFSFYLNDYAFISNPSD
jgi:hypothetical protein